MQQHLVGPQGGLTIDLAINMKDNVWTTDRPDQDREGGFKILVSPSPVLPLLSPLTASDKTETFIKVVANERILENDCYPSPDHLPKVIKGSFYDPYGHMCIADSFEEWMHEMINCYESVANYIPNSSMVCHPEMKYLAALAIKGVFDNLVDEGKSGFSKAGTVSLIIFHKYKEKLFNKKFCIVKGSTFPRQNQTTWEIDSCFSEDHVPSTLPLLGVF